MAEPAIVAKGIAYRVGAAELVAGVDMVANPGQLTAVIGPNGAGKSTLLRLLAGDLIPHEGGVRIAGLDTTTVLPGDLAQVRAVLTQRTPIDIPYTATQVVQMGRFPHRRNPDNSAEGDAVAVATAMQWTATEAFAARSFATLSGGERTRVSLARVLAQETGIVLLDEPTTALDVAYQERIMAIAARVAAQGRTVVMVLHDLNAAARYADRIFLMEGGRMVAHGVPREVLRPELLSRVYGQALAVVEHPLHDGLLVLVDRAAAPAEGAITS